MPDVRRTKRVRGRALRPSGWLVRCAAVAAILAAGGAAGAERPMAERPTADRNARRELDAAFRERLAVLQSKRSEERRVGKEC